MKSIVCLYNEKAQADISVFERKSLSLTPPPNSIELNDNQQRFYTPYPNCNYQLYRDPFRV